MNELRCGLAIAGPEIGSDYLRGNRGARRAVGQDTGICHRARARRDVGSHRRRLWIHPERRWPGLPDALDLGRSPLRKRHTICARTIRRFSRQSPGGEEREPQSVQRGRRNKLITSSRREGRSGRLVEGADSETEADLVPTGASMASHRKSMVSFSEAFASTATTGMPAGAYYRHGHGGNFIQDSFHSSTDFPTYIAWQTLSTDLSERMRQGSVRLSRTNTLEYAPITEENGEKAPLLNIPDDAGLSESTISTPAIQQGVAWTVAAFLLVNSALGAGVLNYPAAYDRAGGILAATLLQILMICLNVVTMLILGYCSDLNGDNTFHDVLLTTCGRRAQQIAAISILLSCYGISITFLIVIGDQYDRLFASLFGPVFCHEWYLNRQFTTFATAVLFIMPLCYFQRLDFLKYARPDNLIDLVITLPVICFAYQAHEVVVPIYANMRDRRLANLAKATILTTIFLFVIYTLMGTFGYMAYGSHVKPDIMQMFDASNPWVLFGIGALIVKMVTTYPLLTFCGR
ncbi:hypothetical protein HPB52_002596 [Rhipicephalus sanguineus]|uniref:Amino acid transporter transmembrane domain-containing protein n=1 Tax=Rhipicephalus sanguineus TaxID=34632 RepID=A0A9D4T8B7_RHISA|nr:hypothetical protein HPB52_002596 [Rhipicephalus sanguineus]